MPDVISIGCAISRPGGSLSVEDPASGYKLESSTAGERQVSHRKQTAKNPFVEGEFTVASVRENVTETLAVWVTGSTPAQLRVRLNALTDCLEQIQYTISFVDEDSTETWTCQPADYSIKSTIELRHARKALVVAQVPRRPTVVYT